MLISGWFSLDTSDGFLILLLTKIKTKTLYHSQADKQRPGDSRHILYMTQT